MWSICLIFYVFVLSCETAKNNVTSWEEAVRLRRQSSAQKCTLPPYPDNGSYSVGGTAQVKPGDQVSSAQLQVFCNPGYRPSGNDLLYCIAGSWTDKFPTCVRFCKLDPHPSVKYRCQATSDESEDSYYRECNSEEPTGTIVRPQCNEPNYRFTGVLSHMRCNEGRWNYIAICQPECGTVTPDGKSLIIDGRESKKGEFPWHAGIYQKPSSGDAPPRQICGGSLVSQSVVISAAHCFWDKVTNKVRPATLFAVALGKLYRGWNNPLDENVQQFDVENIKVPARFQGASSNFQDDIATLSLSKPAVYATHIRPVCLDFEPYFDVQQLRDGNLGKVAGWGVKDLEGKASPFLQVIELPYVRIEQCIEESPPTFRPFITSDKICAGYTNGSALCQGDSGGGLVFMARDRGVERYFLRGIVSTAPESDKACNAFARTSFTRITKHKDFIEKNTVDIDQRIAIPQEIDPVDSLCILPPYPKDGTYIMSGLPNARPGQGYYSVYLSVSCNSGFVLERNVTVSCTYGRWSEEIPKCNDIRNDHCFRPKDWEASYQCSDNISSAGRPCNEYEPNGNVAIRECSQNNLYFKNRKILADEIAQCVNASWNADLDCKSVTNCETVILPGGNEMPWVAAVYERNVTSGEVSQRPICGGTVVNSKYIITAAHCVSDTEGVEKDPENLLIAVGKLYPKYDDQRDGNSQFSNVSEIVFPGYRESKRYEKDMVLLVLTNRLTINSYVQPVCFDLTYDRHNPQLKDAVTKVGSWGIQNNNITDGRLVTLSFKLTEKNQCRNEIRQDFRQYLTADKLCAEDIAAIGVCPGDSGMGLVYPVNGRYVMLGVMSVTHEDKTACSVNKPTLFSSLYPTVNNKSLKLADVIKLSDAELVSFVNNGRLDYFINNLSFDDSLANAKLPKRI